MIDYNYFFSLAVSLSFGIGLGWFFKGKRKGHSVTSSAESKDEPVSAVSDIKRYN